MTVMTPHIEWGDNLSALQLQLLLNPPFAELQTNQPHGLPGDNFLYDTRWDTYRVGTGWDSMIGADGKLIAPVDGEYLISGMIYIVRNPAEPSPQIEIRLDSSTMANAGISNGYPSGTGDQINGFSQMRPLLAGESVRVRWQALDGAGISSSLVATAPSPASSGTSIIVTGGQGSRFATPALQTGNAQVSGSTSSILATPRVAGVNGWSTDEWVGRYVYISSGTASPNIRQITGNDANRLGVTPAFSATPDATTVYNISLTCAVQPSTGSTLSSQCELVHVLSRATDTLTVIRQAESSAARAILVGDRISVCRFNNPYASGVSKAWFQMQYMRPLVAGR